MTRSLCFYIIVIRTYYTLTLQVNEIKSLLTSILKGKVKEMDPENMILELPKVGGSKALVSKISKKKKKPARQSRSASKSSRSESEGSERSGRSSSSSSSPSPSRSPSPSPARQAYIRFEDMGKDLKNALRVSILFVYLPNCILTDLCFTISLKLSG